MVDPSYGGGRIQRRDAQGNWSVIATGGIGLGQVLEPTALAVDGAGVLYAADYDRVQERDAQGSWSIAGVDPDFFRRIAALVVDDSGSLYLARSCCSDPIQKRSAQGSWSVVATRGTGLGQVGGTTALAVDGAGHLYVADRNGLVQEYTPDP